MTPKTVENFKLELASELTSLLRWWTENMQDHTYGGFYGKISNSNVPELKAAKGLVLNTRILYTFSEAFLLRQNAADLAMAKRAYTYLTNHFLDQTDGGFYWSVDFKGQKLDAKKQVYGQAFAIYALSSYYKATQDTQALALAKTTYELLEKHSFDAKNLGYIEALTHRWQPIDDLRLSKKDLNEKKSMNTHLHVIEAYANLYTIWKDEGLKIAIKNLLSNFKNHIINPHSYHLHLFFTEDWTVRSTAISFGHDIEAAWLLQEATEIIGDFKEYATFKTIALQLTKATEKGLADNGGLYYEYEPLTEQWTKDFHWWPQAEAMVGFYNAYQLSNQEKFFLQTLNCWEFIKKHLKDEKNGEWFWGVDHQLSIMQDEDKAGFWKCPYHNGRALMELIKRLA